MLDIEMRKKIEGIILKKPINESKKQELITFVFQDPNSIPIIGIIQELEALKISFSDEEKAFLKQVYNKYGW